jgi:TPR repeat protein
MHPNGHYRVTHEAYLRAAMAAAEEEGNPWAASELMNLTNGRFGESRKPTRCLAEWMPDGKCAPEELLPISSARKWAEIAAEGGNAQAQEWLCWSAADGNPNRGQPRDDSAAFKWCQIAAHNACAYWSLGRLQTLYSEGRGVTQSNETADRIGKWNKQPWRMQSDRFFAPQQ